MSKRTRINYEMVATERGRVINFSSFAEMALAQIDRNKTGIRNSDMRMDVQCVSILVDAVLKDNGFKYLHSAVGKSDTALPHIMTMPPNCLKSWLWGLPNGI